MPDTQEEISLVHACYLKMLDLPYLISDECIKVNKSIFLIIYEMIVSIWNA